MLLFDPMQKVCISPSEEGEKQSPALLMSSQPDVLWSSPRLHCCFSSEGKGIALVPRRVWLTFQHILLQW